MKFFLFITLFSAFMLFGSKPFNQKAKPSKRTLPKFITDRRSDLKDQFQSPQNANLLWAFLTGEKKGISPKVLKNFDDLEINFFFSPSGIHLSAFFALIFYWIKKLKHKKLLKISQWVFLSMALFLPYLAIKRIACLRLLILLQRIFKKNFPIEFSFMLTFAISFLMGHFTQSPLGFILSFLYMGTFLALRDCSRFTILLGLFSSHLIVCFFSGSELSVISLILNLPIISLFSILLPLSYLYFFTFQWIHFNWIELIIRSFILIVRWIAMLTQGTFVSSSFILILAVWIILLKKQKRYLALLLLLHGNAALSPALFSAY